MEQQYYLIDSYNNVKGKVKATSRVKAFNMAYPNASEALKAEITVLTQQEFTLINL